MSEQPDSTIEPTPKPADDSESGDDSTVLQHVTVEHDDDIAVCTIFPRGLEADEISSQWLTSTGDSFVSLADRR